MPNVYDIACCIEELAPPSFACEWDNVGLIVGNKNKKVNKVLVTLDVDTYVVDEAVKINADLIVSHHPLMFHPIKRLNEQDTSQEVLIKLIKNDISLYSAHTNLDVAVGGLNDYMASKLNMKNTKVLDVCGVCDKGEYGFGRFCTLEAPMPLSEILKKCKEAFSLSAIKYCGDKDRIIKKIAVNCGGGSGSIECCYAHDIDLFISGDFKYNTFRDAYEHGLAVIDAGHYNSEFIVKDLFFDYLSKHFNNISIEKSKSNIDIVNIYE